MVPILNDKINVMCMDDMAVDILCQILCLILSISFSFSVWNRLSTYEYIVRQRHRQEARDSRKPPPENESGIPKMNLIKVLYVAQR